MPLNWQGWHKCSISLNKLSRKRWRGLCYFSYCSTSARLKLVSAEPCSSAPGDVPGPSGNSLCLLSGHEVCSGPCFAGRTGSCTLFRETRNSSISRQLHWVHTAGFTTPQWRRACLHTRDEAVHNTCVEIKQIRSPHSCLLYYIKQTS